MPLVINDPETIAALARLAAERGTTEEQVVRELALRNASANPREGLAERILAIGRAAAAKVPEHERHDNHAELLYDEHGLPK